MSSLRANLKCKVFLSFFPKCARHPTHQMHFYTYPYCRWLTEDDLVGSWVFESSLTKSSFQQELTLGIEIVMISLENANWQIRQLNPCDAHACGADIFKTFFFKNMLQVKSHLSYHPAGISKIGDFDSNRFCVSRVQWVDEEICCSGANWKGKEWKIKSAVGISVQHTSNVIDLKPKPDLLWFLLPLNSCSPLRDLILEVTLQLEN